MYARESGVDLSNTTSYLREWLIPLLRSRSLYKRYLAYRHQGLDVYVRFGGLLLGLIYVMTLAGSWLYYPQLDPAEARQWLLGCLLVNVMATIPVLLAQFRFWRNNYDLMALPFAIVITVKLAVMPQLFSHPGVAMAESYFCILAIFLISLALRLSIFSVAAYIGLSIVLSIALLLAILPASAIAWDELFFYLIAISGVCMKVSMIQDASQAQTFILAGIIEEKNLALTRLADEDGLTGLANRRAFDTALKQQWQSSKRNRTALAVLFIDVDHFKPYNDHYGHDAGDICLRNIATSIRSALLRESDLAARYGGEEFVVLLADISEQGALDVAHRVLEHIDMQALPHAGIGPGHHVTASIGVAHTVPGTSQADDGFRELLRRADDALYQAKHRGRHRVEIADPAGCGEAVKIDLDQDAASNHELV